MDDPEPQQDLAVVQEQVCLFNNNPIFSGVSLVTSAPYTIAVLMTVSYYTITYSYHGYQVYIVVYECQHYDACLQ